MRDRVPNPAYVRDGAVRMEQLDENGNHVGYVYLRRADDPIVAGTPYNTKSVLANDTAKSLGLDSKATPNMAFAQLAKFVNAPATVEKIFDYDEYSGYERTGENDPGELVPEGTYPVERKTTDYFMLIARFDRLGETDDGVVKICTISASCGKITELYVNKGESGRRTGFCFNTYPLRLYTSESYNNNIVTDASTSIFSEFGEKPEEESPYIKIDYSRSEAHGYGLKIYGVKFSKPEQIEIPHTFDELNAYTNDELTAYTYGELEG